MVILDTHQPDTVPYLSRSTRAEVILPAVSLPRGPSALRIDGELRTCVYRDVPSESYHRRRAIFLRRTTFKLPSHGEFWWIEPNHGFHHTAG